MAPDSLTVTARHSCPTCGDEVNEIAVACDDCASNLFSDRLKRVAVTKLGETIASGAMFPSGGIVLEGEDSPTQYMYNTLEEMMEAFDDCDVVFEGGGHGA